MSDKGADGILGDEPDGKVTPEERAEFKARQKREKESQGGTTGKIPWKTNSTGDAILIRKSLDEAKGYMVPGVPEYTWLQSTFKTLKANKAISNRTPDTFWASMVDKAEASGGKKTPFQVAQDYLKGYDGEDGLLTTGGSGLPSSYSTVSVQQYDRTTADSVIDNVMLSMFGRKADDVEKNNFFKEFNAAAKAGTVSRVSRKGNVTTTTTTKAFDEKDFTDKYIGRVLDKVSPNDEYIDLGGKLGETQDALRQNAENMGIFLSDREIISNVRKIVKGEITAEDVLADNRKQAASLYKNFSERLLKEPGLTVRDLANPYIKLMADTFETDMNNISLTDATIQGLINGDTLPSYGDAYKRLRQDGRFRNTTTAQKEASSFASGLASAMGF
jgi:hypothetical protein